MYQTCFDAFYFHSLLFMQIVTLGMPTVAPIERVGKYVKPREWNALISDPDTVSHWNAVVAFYSSLFQLISLLSFYF